MRTYCQQVSNSILVVISWVHVATRFSAVTKLKVGDKMMAQNSDNMHSHLKTPLRGYTPIY